MSVTFRCSIFYPKRMNVVAVGAGFRPFFAYYTTPVVRAL